MHSSFLRDIQVMQYYPAFLNLRGKQCLVAGAGAVGLRKARGLAQCGPAQVLVVDPAPPSPEWTALCESAPVTYARRPFQDTDLDGRHLVFAATGSHEVNERILTLCRERGILCNRAETPEDSGFIVPAHFAVGDITVAVSTAGSSPALARHLRREMEAWLGGQYGTLARVMARLRPMVLDLGLPQAENAEIFRALTESLLLEALKTKDMKMAGLILRELLPQELHPRIPEVLDGI